MQSVKLLALTALIAADALPQAIVASVTQKVSPACTSEAVAARIEALIRLQVTVTEEGVPTNIHVLNPLGYGLDENAIEAVKHWKFAPGTLDGKPVTTSGPVETAYHCTPMSRPAPQQTFENWQIDHLDKLLKDIPPFDFVVTLTSSKSDLTQAALSNDVELSLRRYHLPIDRNATGGRLIINVSFECDSSPCAYYVNASYREWAYPVRVAQETVFAPIWDDYEFGTVGMNKLDTLRGTVKDLVEKFALAYLRANAK